MVNIVCCRSCACECPVAVAADARESRRARGEGLVDESRSAKINRRIGSDSDLLSSGCERSHKVGTYSVVRVIMVYIRKTLRVR